MAQLRDLLVNGASRFLGAVNFNDATTFNNTALFNSTSTFKDTLTIAKSGADVEGTAAAAPSLIIGDATGTHLAIDDNEIMAKTAANTPGTLHFNINGGQVRFGCHIEPGSNGTADIGASGNRWRTIYANTFDGNATNASWGDLLAIHNTITSTTTRTATRSTWTGGLSGLKYVWGQAWKDSTISSDSGDLVLGLRAGSTSGSTELCMMIDGDYFVMGNKVLHAGNYTTWAAPKSHSSTDTTYGGADTNTYGHVKLHTSTDCTTYTSDDGAATPAAVKKAFGLFNAVSATKATNDVNGQPIHTTYAKLASANTFTANNIFSGGLELKNNMTWHAPNNISCYASANSQEWSIDLGADGKGYTGTYFHVWSSKLGASILACYTDDKKVKAFANMEVGSNLSVGGTATVAGQITSTGAGVVAAGTIKSTYAGPAFFADVTTGNWAYQRLRSGNDTYMWDIAIKSNDLDGALQFRPSGAGGGRMYITRGGNVSIGGTELAISVNKVKLQYVAATESLDFIFG